MSELLNSPVSKDVRPISGTVTFAPGATMATLQVGSVEDVEEEGNEVFTLALMSARGGAALSDGGDVALLSGELSNSQLASLKDFLWHYSRKHRQIQCVLYMQ